uniref:G-protein coupled receptors family 3 profile domain-containing protein n=1 Tax=Loxodonta africana TaxID=9785 RepID=G3TU51_LOXAF
VSTEGDMLIRAVTPLHAVLNQPEVKFQQPLEQLLCQRFKVHFVLQALGLLFAVAEVKGDPTILPNITVGLHIYDSCISGIQALGSTPPLLSNQPQPTPNFSCGPQQLLLSPSTWLSCSLFTESLSNIKIYTINHGSQHPQFSNSLHLPSFLCTVLSNAHQPWVLAQLLSHFNWTWVGLVGADNGNFEWLDQQLQEEMRHGDGCLAFSKIISPGNSISSTARTTASSPAARVIVCDCYRFHVRLPGEEWTRRMWIFSTSFFYDPLVLGPRAQELLNGSLVLAIHSGVMPGFEDFLLALCPAIYPGNSLMRKLWEKLQGCRLPASTPSTQSARDATKHCTGLESMTAAHLSVFKLSDLTATYQAYVATKTLLAAYQNLVSCAPGEGPFLGGACASAHNAKPWHVLHYTQKVRFTTRVQEEVFFTKDGEMLSAFDFKNTYVLPDQSWQVAVVEHFDLRSPPGKQLLINDSAIIWVGKILKVPSSVCNEKCPMGTRKSIQYEKSKCCYRCLQCLSGEITKTPDSPTCQKCPEDQWPNLGKSQCIPQTLDFLSYHEPLGTVLVVCTALLFLLTLAILGHHHTPIVRANNHQLSYLLLASLGLCFLCPFMFIGHPGPLTYAVSQAASGVTFTVCVSTVLAKTIMVVAAFHATQPNAKIKKWVGPVLPSTVPIVCSLVQAALCMFWVIGWPPRPVNLTEPGSIATVMCDEGSLELFYAMLGYLGLLGLVSLLVAFPACRLPDTFNEAKHIILSTLVCSCIWVSFTPAMSSHGKDIVAVEVFAILASGAGLMSCLFFPKRYIVLLHPEKNTREPMLGRHH